MLPASLDSKHFVKGSVVKIRNPLEVPLGVRVNKGVPATTKLVQRTDSQVAVVLIESDKVHCHVEVLTQLAVDCYNLCESMDGG